MPFGFARRARCVEDERARPRRPSARARTSRSASGMRRCHQWSRPSFISANASSPPAPGRRCTTTTCSIDGHLLERLVGIPLERNDRAATIAAVGGDEHLALRIVDAIAQRLGREAAEHHRVNRADARAGEHRDRDFGNERHVDRDAVAALHAELLEDVRELLDFDVEVPVGERAPVARLAFPDQRGLVARRAS